MQGHLHWNIKVTPEHRLNLLLYFIKYVTFLKILRLLFELKRPSKVQGHEVKGLFKQTQPNPCFYICGRKVCSKKGNKRPSAV